MDNTDNPEVLAVDCPGVSAKMSKMVNKPNREDSQSRSRELLSKVRKQPDGSQEQRQAFIEYLKALDAEPSKPKSK
jgi:hypothetical protein